MKITEEYLAIRNFVVFEELLFHSIVLSIQHVPRNITKLFRSTWCVPKEVAIYSFIHYQLSQLPYLEKMEQIRYLQSIVLRNAIFHLQHQPDINLSSNQHFLCLLNAELNAQLAHSPHFRTSIRSFNYAYVLLAESNIYEQKNPSYKDIAQWANWYYLGLKKFLQQNLKYPSSDTLDTLFELCFLQAYLQKQDNPNLQEEFQIKHKLLLEQTKESVLERFVALL